MHCEFEGDIGERIHSKGILRDGTKTTSNYNITNSYIQFQEQCYSQKYCKKSCENLTIRAKSFALLLLFQVWPLEKKQFKSKMRCLACKEEHHIKQCTKDIITKTCF